MRTRHEGTEVDTRHMIQYQRNADQISVRYPPTPDRMAVVKGQEDSLMVAWDVLKAVYAFGRTTRENCRLSSKD